ncbi:hypothetical protein [Paenibacillus polymyxa]|nr:hypothetical protein [Paenibacillus polymyxa]
MKTLDAVLKVVSNYYWSEDFGSGMKTITQRQEKPPRIGMGA